MLILLLISLTISYTNADKELISSYRTDYRSIIIFKHLPNNFSKIHYKPNFSKEQLPLKNHRPFGAFFPYGGIIQFDEPIPKENMISIRVPHECRNIYISTLSNSFFRIGTSPSNVTFEKNLKLCLFNFGNPSEISVKMNTESFSKLSFLSIDNSSLPQKYYSGNLSFTQKFKESALLFFQTSYFYLNNFINITIKQISNAQSIEPHSIFFTRSSIDKNSLCLLLEDQIEEHQDDGSSDLNGNAIKPTFHHQINDFKSSYDDDYKPSYDLGHNDDDYTDENSMLVKMIVISVFMICGAILLGCCGLVCIGCYSCTNKSKNNDIITKTQNKNSSNALLLNHDINFDDAIPPTIPQPQQPYQQQQYYPSFNNQPQAYFYVQNGYTSQQNYPSQPAIIQHHPRQYTD